MPKRGERLLYCDHIDANGRRLFELACQHDLQGIVAKSNADPYLPEHTTWLNIRKTRYSQWVGLEELFERERASDPDWHHWNAPCASACDQVAERG